MIYLDNAATTLIKPKSVAHAAAAAMSTMATPGRGGYRASMAAAEMVYECRETAARLFNMQNPEKVVFTSSATHGLNIAIKGLLSKEGTAVISGYEHNAVVRPIFTRPDAKKKTKIAEFNYRSPEKALEAFEWAIQKDTDCVICNYVSNVYGCVLPVYQIGELCRRRGVAYIVDASQAAGCMDIDMMRLHADFVCMPGHKGLYGPQGTGILLIGGEKSIPALIEGGTGVNSAMYEQPDIIPERYESGTPNIPGIAGLLEGLAFIEKTGTQNILLHERAMNERLCELLKETQGVTVYGHERKDAFAGVLSFNIDGMDCEIAADKLAGMGVAMRAGLHCAPLAHRTGGTFKTGTVRASVSYFTRMEDIKAAAEAVAAIAHAAKNN